MSLLSKKIDSDPAHQTNLRVMVVDDSAVARGLIARWIEAEDKMDVVARCRTGQVALDSIDDCNPDVCILDIEMPDMDGLTALPLLLKKKPDLIVIMASALTQRNARESLRALALGAVDYIPKPGTNSALTTNQEFRHEIIEKTRGLASAAYQRKHGREAPFSRRARPISSRSVNDHDRRKPVVASSSAHTARLAQTSAPTRSVLPDQPATMRLYKPQKCKILALGSSTGGPQALQSVLEALAGKLDNVTVVITQHMPKTFTTILAEHIERVTKYPTKEADDNEKLMPGRIYVAPGGLHMIVEAKSTGPVARLMDTAPINYCKPAVDPLFASLAKNYAKQTLGVVLTGMGQDGARGAANLSDAGANVIAQDEASSVVWGMPGATYKSGACCKLVKLDDMPKTIYTMINGGRV